MGIMTTISVIQTVSNRTPDAQPAIAMEGGAADRNHSGEGQGGTHTTGNHGGRGDTMGWGGGGGLAALHYMHIYIYIKYMCVCMYVCIHVPIICFIIRILGALFLLCLIESAPCLDYLSTTYFICTNERMYVLTYIHAYTHTHMRRGGYARLPLADGALLPVVQTSL